MRTLAMTITMIAATAAMLFLATPAMAYQPAEIWEPAKPQFDRGMAVMEIIIPAVEDAALPGDGDENGVAGCEDAEDPVALNCPGEEQLVPGNIDPVQDDGINQNLPPGDDPPKPPEDTPQVTPPTDPPGSDETPPVTPPSTSTSSKLPKTGTYLALMAGAGMLVATGAFGARLIIRRRMK